MIMQDKQLFVPFSTGFTSTANDRINAERAAEIGREIQKKLDEQPNHGSEIQGKGLIITQKDSQAQ